MADSSKVYLGDSVYCPYDGYHIWLTTWNGYPDDPLNKIALDPHVTDALFGYITRLYEQQEAENHERANSVAEVK